MGEITDLEREKIVGWLFVSSVPQYVISGVKDAELMAMQRARQAVTRLERVGQLGPLMAAFEVGR